MADSGGVTPALPDAVDGRLGIPIRRTVATTYADGRLGDLRVAGALTIRIGNRKMSTDCIVAPEQAEQLVGQLVLEQLNLIASPLNQALGPRPGSSILLS